MARVNVHSTRLRYRSVGDDLPPLLLIHGAAGGLYVWLEQLTGLEPRRVVALDLPGHGDSAAGEDPGIAGYARAVLGLADALELERFIPMGHSMGGAIALTLALEHPDRLAGLVLVSTGARLPVSDLVFGAIQEQFDDFSALVGQMAYSPATPAETVARWTSAPLQVDQATARIDFQSCAAFDVRDRLPEISLPTLVVHGADDALVGAGRCKQLAAGISGSQLEILEGAGHMVMQEKPEQVNALLQSFLSRIT